MNKPHKHAELIKAWADGAEIERFDTHLNKWEVLKNPSWVLEHKYRVKPTPVITKRYFHLDNFEQAYKLDWENVTGLLRKSNYGMNAHIELTFTDGKVTGVEIKCN